MCRRCSLNGVRMADRRYRLVDHILKYHIPMDRVPYSCSLCMFRCMEQQTLLNHVTKYQRHVRLAKELKVTNHIQFMVVAKQPVVIGDDDMVPVAREEVSGTSASVESPFDDGNLEEDLLDAFGTPPPEAQVPPVLGKRSSITSQLPQVEVGWMQATQPTAPSAPALTLPAFPSVMVPGQIPNTNLQMTKMVDSASQFRTINEADVSALGVVQAGGVLQKPTVVSSLSAFRKLSVQVPKATPLITPSQDQVNSETPLLDEGFQSLFDIDPNDPLVLEGQQLIQGLEPPRKKRATETATPSQASVGVQTAPEATQPVLDLQAVINAVTSAAKTIAEAVDRNARAVRCQGTTLERMVTELEYMNRQLKFKRESVRADSSDKTNSTLKGKENKPALKSVVTDKSKK